VLAQAGRPADALAVTEQTVAAYRELAAARPDRYRPDLAAALARLTDLLTELGQTSEARKIPRKEGQQAEPA
jgi:hypothetical protein